MTTKKIRNWVIDMTAAMFNCIFLQLRFHTIVFCSIQAGIGSAFTEIPENITVENCRRPDSYYVVTM